MANNITSNTFKPSIDKKQYLLKLAPHFSVFDIAEKFKNSTDAASPFFYQDITSTSTLDTNFKRAMIKILPISMVKSIEILGSEPVYESFSTANDEKIFIVIAAGDETVSFKVNKDDSKKVTVIGVGF